MTALGGGAVAGTGYAYKLDGELIVVVYNKDACGVMIQSGGTAIFKQELKNRFKLGNNKKFEEGYQVTELFQFQNDSWYAGGVLFCLSRKWRVVPGELVS